MTRTLILLSLSVVAAGCAKHATAAGPGMNDKREDALIKQAEPAINCKKDEMTVTFEQSIESNYHVYRVDGCGQKYTSILHCTGPACSWIEGPEQAASVELQCPVPQLSRTYANQIFTVSGCGRQKEFTLAKGKITAQ